MPLKLVKCSNSKCGALYRQNVDPDIKLRVDACEKCGAFGILKTGQGFLLTQLPHPHVLRTSRWDCRMIERALEGSVEYRKLLVASFTLAGYEFIGFHGCDFKSACSMMRAGIDPEKTTNDARGKGFYVGSLYEGTASTWSKMEKNTNPTILAVYVKGFDTMTWGTDYDWGKMDGDDIVELTGLEIVFRPQVCNRLCIVPAHGDEISDLWGDCPIDSFNPEERELFKRVALTVGVNYNKLATMIMDDEFANEESRKEIVKKNKLSQMQVDQIMKLLEE